MAAGSTLDVDAAGVVVGGEVVVAGGGVGGGCQTMVRMERATATRALSLLRRLTRRRYRAPGKVSVFAAAAAASPSTPLRYGLPLPVLPARWRGPD
jgi:hypothetical protein